MKNDVAPRPATHVTALPADYPAVLEELKRRIRTVQLRAAVSVNRELIALHWHIGKSIAERQRSEGWGKSVANRLAKDLQGEFPGMAGFSPSNIQIESDLFGRQSQAVTNFRATLPPPQSDLAQQVLKDPYNFDFLALAADARERELEQGLLAHLRKFLLELGAGFAFVGQQHSLEVGGEDFYLDLLFYHLRLRCFVVVGLKMEPFKPEFAGKTNFYLSALDDLLRHQDDQPSTGLILCKERNRLVVEHALRDTRKPIGVSAYRITARLPERLKGSLPTVEQLEAELSGGDANPGAWLTG